MRNPLTSLKVPVFKDYPEKFSEVYKISIIKELDTHREFLGLGQEYRNTCFIACIRSVLLNDFNIKFSHEHDLIRLATDIDKAKLRISGYYYDEQKNNIKQEGAAIKHLKNIANFFQINAFNSNKAKPKELIKLIDNGINPIVFRTMHDKDRDGHYIITYAYDNEKIYYFDPAYRGQRPKDNIPHKGIYRKQTLEKFLEKWTNSYFKGGYVFLYDKRERPKLKLDGYYLT